MQENGGDNKEHRLKDKGPLIIIIILMSAHFFFTPMNTNQFLLSAVVCIIFLFGYASRNKKPD